MFFENWPFKALTIFDILIIIFYFAVTLYLGFRSSKKITDFKSFAIGEYKFTTPMLVSTIFATVIGTEDVIGMSGAIYNTSILWILLFLGNFFTGMLVAKFIAPRIGKFKGCVSAAEMIGKSYGKNAQIVAGISGVVISVGYISAQFLAMGMIINVFTDLPSWMGVLIAASVVIIYSTEGGINSVTITDVAQFIFIIIAVPLVCNLGLMQVGGYEGLFTKTPAAKFNIIPEGENLWTVIYFFMIFYIPFLGPEGMQRLLMADTPSQARLSKYYASLVSLPFYLMIGAIGLTCAILYPGQGENISIINLIEDIVPNGGLKGLVIAGLLAVAMSTADSFLNLCSVMMVSDVIKPIKGDKFLPISQLKIAKYTNFLAGSFAIIAAISFNNIVELVLEFLNAWGPIVTIPLFACIMGVRASEKTFLYSASAGFITFLMWKIFKLNEILYFGPTIPAMLANATTFFIHRKLENKYIIQQNTLPFCKLTGKIKNSLSFNTVDIARYMKDKTADYAQYTVFGTFAVMNYIVPFYMWAPNGTYEENKISMWVRLISGIFCAILIMRDRLPIKIRQYVPFYWYFVLLFTLPFSTTYFFLENNASLFSIINLTLGVFLLSILTDWLSFLILLIIGVMLGYGFCIIIHPADRIITLSNELKYVIFYLTFFASLIGIIFTRNREYLQNRIRRFLQSEVNEKTNELQTVNTQLIHLNEELLSALRVKKRFLNNISHEIRTPLQILFSKASRLSEEWDHLSDEERKSEAKLLNEQNKDLYLFVSSILDIAALEAGSIMLDKTANINFENIIPRILDSYEEKIKEKKLRVNLFRNGENFILPNADERRMEGAISCIIENAIKYSVENGEIDIKLANNKTQLLIEIKDSGIGIPEGEFEKIFEPFSESTRTKTLSGGKGLGLALARLIILKHNGKVWAENNREQGSIFYINFELPEIVTEKSEIEIDHKSMNIIVVDDVPNVLSSIELVLMGIGCKYELFSDPIEALKYINENHVDIVITDFMMQPITGLELAEEIRKIKNYDNLPIILQSGVVSEDEYASKMDTLQIKTFLPKPHRREAIEQAIIEAYIYSKREIA